MASKLNIEFPITNNTKILRLFDISEYSQGITVSCGQLLITVPGFNYAVPFNVDPTFNLSLNSNNLNLSSTYDYNLADLPDGIYIIHYSINPNEKVWVEYNHLRNTIQLKEYSSKLCQIYNDIDITPKERNSKLEELRKIKLEIDGAKSLVEWCNSPIKGLELYTSAQKKLSKFSSCSTC